MTSVPFLIRIVLAGLLTGALADRATAENGFPLHSGTRGPPAGPVTTAPPATPLTHAGPLANTGPLANPGPNPNTPPSAEGVHERSSTTARARSSLRRSTKESGHANAAQKTSETPTAMLSPWTTAGALAVVVALILVLARVFRQHGPLLRQGLPPEALEVLGRRFVESRQAIYLVRVGSRILVIGSSSGGLRPLGEINDPVEVDFLAGSCRRDADQGRLGASFVKLIQGQLRSHAAVPGARPRPAAANAASRTETAPPAARPFATTTADRVAAEHELIARLRGEPRSAVGHAPGGRP